MKARHRAHALLKARHSPRPHFGATSSCITRAHRAARANAYLELERRHGERSDIEPPRPYARPTSDDFRLAYLRPPNLKTGICDVAYLENALLCCPGFLFALVAHEGSRQRRGGEQKL